MWEYVVRSKVTCIFDKLSYSEILLQWILKFFYKNFDVCIRGTKAIYKITFVACLTISSKHLTSSVTLCLVSTRPCCFCSKSIIARSVKLLAKCQGYNTRFWIRNYILYNNGKWPPAEVQYILFKYHDDTILAVIKKNNNVARIKQWALENNMIFNEAKTKEIVFWRPRSNRLYCIWTQHLMLMNLLWMQNCLVLYLMLKCMWTVYCHCIVRAFISWRDFVIKV